jgi:hypothetical protein
MQTHSDADFPDLLFEQLKDRAAKMTQAQENMITAGAPGEEPLESWMKATMEVRRLPDDPQGVQRISVGGGVGFGYCVFRGSREACRTLLKQAWKALER